MENIINNNNLLRELRRLTEEEVKKIVPEGQVASLWDYLNQLNERIKVLEKS